MMRTKSLVAATITMLMPLAFTSCDDILGEWSKPTPTIITLSEPEEEPEEEEEPDPMLTVPLTFKAGNEAVTVTISNGMNSDLTIKYAKNGGNKTSLTISAGGTDNSITINAGEMVQLYGTE